MLKHNNQCYKFKTSFIYESMKVLQTIYGGRQDVVSRGKLKERILREFPDQLIHVDTLGGKNMYICKTAAYIQKDILDFAEKVSEANWPPTAEELSTEERRQPEFVTMFLMALLKTPQYHKSTIGNQCMRLIDS